jgi:hypothetical protein
MPHQKINLNRSHYKKGPTSTDNTNYLIVGWNEIGWVQVSVAPCDWTSTGDWMIADLTSKDVDELIKTLKKARRKAYGNGSLPNFSEVE